MKATTSALHELSRADFALAAPLFADIPHHRVIVFSVLEGRCPGRVFVDDRRAPQAAFVSSASEFFFFGGEAGCQSFNHALQEQVIAGLVAQMGSVVFSGPTPAWQAVIDELLAGYPGGWTERSEFDFPAEQLAHLPDWRRNVPDGLRVETYSRAVAGHFGELEALWGGIDNFLAGGFGFYVARGEEILSHCHTVLLGAGLAEISVETQPASRRQGLAALATSAFIEHSLRAGLKPHWTCWRTNQPSFALAEKLAFNHILDAPVRYVQPDG